MGPVVTVGGLLHIGVYLDRCVDKIAGQHRCRGLNLAHYHTTHTVGDMNELIPLSNPNPAALFVPNGLQSVLIRIADDARSLVPDVGSKEGIEAIRSNAAKVARCKIYLDDLGKNYVSELKALPKLVDAERKRARDFLNALRDEVRAPLTAIENAEHSRVNALNKRLLDLTSQGDGLDDAASTVILERILAVKSVSVGEDWQEIREIADERKATVLDRLTRKLRDVEEREIARDRIRELESQAAEHARIERERQLVELAMAEERDKAEQKIRNAKRETEEALMMAAKSNDATTEKVAVVHLEIVASLVRLCVSQPLATSIVSEIARGNIAHLSISY